MQTPSFTSTFLASCVAHAAVLALVSKSLILATPDNQKSFKSLEATLLEESDEPSVASRGIADGTLMTPLDTAATQSSPVKDPDIALTKKPYQETEITLKPKAILKQKTSPTKLPSSSLKTSNVSKVVSPQAAYGTSGDSLVANANPSFGRLKETASTTVDATLLGISPQYPRYSRQHGQEGRVIYKVEIDTSRRVQNYKLIKSSGFPFLDEAALQALKEAKFDGSGDEATIAFTFKLNE